MITNGKTYRFINPRFLDTPSTATHSAPSQYAYLRKRTSQTPAPGAHRLFQSFTRQLDADRLRPTVAVAARMPPHCTLGNYGLT